MKGYVYVLSNPCMPGLVKIGMSTDGGRSRAKQLHTTGVPTPFVVEAEILTKRCHVVEKQVHDDLANFRVSNTREFFSVSVQDAMHAVMDRCAHDIGAYVVSLDDCDDLYRVDMTADIAGMSRREIIEVLELIPRHELRTRYARFLRELRTQRFPEPSSIVSGGA